MEIQTPILATLAAKVSSSVLYGLVALFLLILVCLVACVIILRRRARATARALEAERDAAVASSDALAGSGAWLATASSDAMTTDDPMACPSCRRELEPGLNFCPYDATRLLPASQMLDHVLEKRQGTRVCPSCRRAFEGAVRFCPHDGSDLVPMTQRQPGCDHDHGDTRVAKICPRCRGRYEYAALFCGKDGVELVVLN